MKKIALSLFAILLTVSAFAGQKTVKVSTARQLINALRSDTKIVVTNDILDLTQTMLQMKDEGSLPFDIEGESIGPSAVSEYDGPSLLVNYCDNLTITGAKKGIHIQVTPRYANVFGFNHCRNINISNLKLGHTDAGDCVGDVLYFEHCEEVAIEDCNLYGCGVIGIEARYSKNLKVNNSDIYECSQEMFDLYHVSNMAFNNCQFYENGGGIHISESCRGIEMNNCDIHDNIGSLYIISSPLKISNSKIVHHWGAYSDIVTYDNCTLDIEQTEGEYPDYSDEDEEDECYGDDYDYSEEADWEGRDYTLNDMEDVKDFEFLTNEQKNMLFGDLRSLVLNYMEEHGNYGNNQDFEEVYRTLMNGEPLKITANELLGYKRVRSTQIKENGIYKYDFFPCKFTKEADLLCFNKTGGSQRKWGQLSRVDDRHIAFSGCWYIGGDKPTYFTDESKLAVGQLVKLTPSTIIIIFPDENDFEIYEFSK